MASTSCFPTESSSFRYYVTKHLFKADMNRIFTNCRLYNSPETEYYKCTEKLETYFNNKMKEHGLMD